MSAPLVIAHRGASGDRPEHTRSAYERAVEQGADAIEPDLVMTRDGQLVVRHENEIGGTTDVADHAGFADRRVTRTVDGQAVTGWFTEDFTLSELKTLRARERLPALRPGNAAFDGQEPILTFQDVIDIARAGSTRTGRTIRIVPELKHPGHFTSAGLPMLPPFLAAVRANGLDTADAPIIVQCFEVGPLEALAAGIDAPLMLLIANGGAPADRPDLTCAEMTSPEGLGGIAAYADWIGVEAGLIEPAPGEPTRLITDAHTAGIKVAAWTFRAENVFLLPADRVGEDPAGHGRMGARVRRFAGYGVDAVFSDHPFLAREGLAREGLAGEGLAGD
ncbi:glycerophosphodiester phosphodiesterase family protein [Brevundimonas lenta]|uniref:glycerophosphodiester phosphodiesterase n=1 Tax=Brevundimonas lenta TaxID=424796 RepID=A0A7W6JC32_9CAUL|nr:glycerophosphodiester phosphodiesterase family protein [Brevundimonas lenta]MBB4082379.1 glycerophosphoryl diester phosphodiesterase [Brevundimonas lenta]